MRRNELARMGFHTGAPFVPERRMNAKEWHVRFGAKHGMNNPTSPTAETNSLPTRVASSPSRSGSAVVPARRSGEGVAGRLDPGRLALARATYERINSAPNRAAASTAAAAASSSPAMAAAASSAPASRTTSSTKRHRQDNDDEDDAASNASASSSSSKSAKRRRTNPAAIDAAAAADQPPPLETAGGSRVPSAPSQPGPVTAAAPSSSSSSSAPMVLATPLSTLAPTQPRALDVREKSRQLLSNCLQAAIQQNKAAASSTDATAPAAAASSEHSAAAAASRAAPVPLADPADVAEQIELELLQLAGGVTDSAYRQKLRDLVFNFKSNSPLCLRLLRGELPPSDVVRLNFKDLAAPAVAAERERIQQENFDATLFRPAERIETKDYRCPVCASQHCSTLIIREERDISKADTWGSKQGAGSVIEIRCEDCNHLWTKEE